jgi:peptidoglycan lytic transglycosylase
MKWALTVWFSWLVLSIVAVAGDEKGFASWYGEPYHGRLAASGEVYDMDGLTAAHRTLPFGTMVRVHRVDTGASVVVRINDRGPIPEDRIIDLSRAAARSIGMTQPGIAPVVLQVVDDAQAGSRQVYAVQVGAFRVRQNAEKTMLMMARFGNPRIVFRSETKTWSVLVGETGTRAEAESIADRVRENTNLSSAFVVRLEFDDSVIAE